MIYLLLSIASTFFGQTAGLGPTTLLRPLLDAVSPLSPASIAMLSTMAALCAALLSAFFALGQPIPLDQDELLLLAIGAALGGVLGDLASARFIAALPRDSAVLLQNALLFILIALPAIYFTTLSHTLRPLALSRMLSFPVAFFIGLLGSFLAFGAQPLTLMVYFLLFDAENDESAIAALTITLFAMAAKLVTLLIRQRMQLPDAAALLFLVPGVLGGVLGSMLPRMRRIAFGDTGAVLNLSLFTALLNMAAAFAA